MTPRSVGYLNILYSSKAEPETQVCVQSVSSEGDLSKRSEKRVWEEEKAPHEEGWRGGPPHHRYCTSVGSWMQSWGPSKRPCKIYFKSMGWAPRVSVTTTQINFRMCCFVFRKKTVVLNQTTISINRPSPRMDSHFATAILCQLLLHDPKEGMVYVATTFSVVNPSRILRWNSHTSLFI